MKTRLAILVLVVAAGVACNRRGQNTEATPQQPGAARPAPPAAQAAAAPASVASMPHVDATRLLDHIRTLSSDKFEGRAPGSNGEELTVKYITDAFTGLGLKPGNTDGTYAQQVPLVGITGAQSRQLTLTKPGNGLGLRWREDVVAWTKHVADSAAIDKSEVVFCGYGVTAPEFQWDDFKGLDVKGKTVIVLVNDPPVPDPSDASKLDPNTFGGNAMTYYGRWTYKFEEGARRGAAAVFIVHEAIPAGYPFAVVQGNLGEKFDIVTPDKNMRRANIEGWLSLDAARKIFAMAGQDYDALKRQAVSRDFKPVPLGLKASMAIRNTLRTVQSRNVVARLEGSDPQKKDEYIVYSAHWDHLGLGQPVRGDRIYNGARDNASGVAALLEIARAFTEIRPAPKRSILFLAVTAEEQGLLGSQYYSVTPLYPLAKTAADINIDELNVWGRTSDITVIGLGASDLDDYLRQAAQEQNRTLRPDPFPEKGFYYRSDHFNFAKQGVPALYTETGIQSVGRAPDYVKKKLDDYDEHDYHAPSDEVKTDWDLRGAAEDVELLLAVGYRVANAEKLPEWKMGNEFRAKREAMLRK
jgi:Zn-dependent M28 family amino/carboxypeptidase